MTTEHDVMIENRDADLGATDEGFRKWLLETMQVARPLIEYAFNRKDERLIEQLKDRYWETYLNDLFEGR